ncbi:FAD-binding oxidoreductase [Amycolatopsis rubida]|uniref:FAD-binding oxidoreductase n=1 Tax=Amycolatopsis rubida TaxID=112413 RepID=A0ABX0BMG7_9PSEU|nr:MULTISPECIES: FAD-dependent oxidoreductase [Amycolatopsis]MYW90711.1 FAD-dependent oxidoreductase [Amycolatopsis rubida]NEC55694.1 FAD-binding oxidoreductase [Amycolatopsis rubida]OAP23766.1 4-methylaminobutanoate oxidase (formaldehyde-forming) [Amycolatopsis sp. M39]
MGTEIVVVGAGVIGSSVALELARAGHRVTVLDRAAGPGQGSTSASSAVVRYNFSTAAGVAAAWEAHFGWLDWAGHLGRDVGELARFEKSGLVMLDVAAAPRAAWLPLFDEAGVPYEEWDSATLAARVPGIDTGRYWPPKPIADSRFWDDAETTLGGVYTPDAGYVTDPALAAVNLATAAAAHGAEFRFRSQVTSVPAKGGRVAEVGLADGTRLACDVVVNAAGPWSGALNRLAGAGADFAVNVRPMRQEVAHVAAPEGYAGPAIADLDLGVYFRGEVGGGLLIGGTEPECDPFPWLDDPDDAVPHPTMAVFETQVTRAARRLPELAVPNRARGVAGVYDVADDWTPIYDRTGLPGFYVAIGTSGNQFKNAPVVGRFLTALIEQVENGADHDANPVQFRAPHTGAKIDLGAFSRRRSPNRGSSGTVMG